MKHDKKIEDIKSFTVQTHASPARCKLCLLISPAHSKMSQNWKVCREAMKMMASIQQTAQLAKTFNPGKETAQRKNGGGSQNH